MRTPAPAITARLRFAVTARIMRARLQFAYAVALFDFEQHVLVRPWRSLSILDMLFECDLPPAHVQLIVVEWCVFCLAPHTRSD